MMYDSANKHFGFDKTNKNKRRKNGSNEINSIFSFNDENISSDRGRYFIMSAIVPNIRITELDPWILKKGIEAITAHIKDVFMRKDGSVLILTRNQIGSNAIVRANKIGNTDVVCKDFSSMNSCQGVIFAEQLIKVSVEDMKENLKAENVIDVFKITKRDGKNIQQPTNMAILTFNSQIVPANIKIGYLNIKVNPYIANPMRCRKCQKFGHSSKKCFNAESCFICGCVGEHEICHTSACLDCNNIKDDDIESHYKCIGVKCVNCLGDHKSSDRKCPVFLKEYEISKIKCEERVSYFQAKKIYEGKNIAPIMDFAGALHSQSLEQRESQAKTDNAIALLTQRLEEEIKKNNERDMEILRMRAEHIEQLKGFQNLLNKKDKIILKLNNKIKRLENGKNSFESILGISQNNPLSDTGKITESDEEDLSSELAITPPEYIGNFASKKYVLESNEETTQQTIESQMTEDGMDEHQDGGNSSSSHISNA